MGTGPRDLVRKRQPCSPIPAIISPPKQSLGHPQQCFNMHPRTHKHTHACTSRPIAFHTRSTRPHAAHLQRLLRLAVQRAALVDFVLNGGRQQQRGVHGGDGEVHHLPWYVLWGVVLWFWGGRCRPKPSQVQGQAIGRHRRTTAEQCGHASHGQLWGVRLLAQTYADVFCGRAHTTCGCRLHGIAVQVHSQRRPPPSQGACRAPQACSPSCQCHSTIPLPAPQSRSGWPAGRGVCGVAGTYLERQELPLCGGAAAAPRVELQAHHRVQHLTPLDVRHTDHAVVVGAARWHGPERQQQRQRR